MSDGEDILQLLDRRVSEIGEDLDAVPDGDNFERACALQDVYSRAALEIRRLRSRIVESQNTYEALIRRLMDDKAELRWALEATQAT